MRLSATAIDVVVLPHGDRMSSKFTRRIQEAKRPTAHLALCTLANGVLPSISVKPDDPVRGAKPAGRRVGLGSGRPHRRSSPRGGGERPAGSAARSPAIT